MLARVDCARLLLVAHLETKLKRNQASFIFLKNNIKLILRLELSFLQAIIKRKAHILNEVN